MLETGMLELYTSSHPGLASDDPIADILKVFLVYI